MSELVQRIYQSSDDEARAALARVSSGKGSRNRACKCAQCGYSAYTTRKWLCEAGAPCCPAHGAMLPVLLEDVALLDGWEGEAARAQLEAASERSARAHRAAGTRAARREERAVVDRVLQARLSAGDRPACVACGVVRPLEHLDRTAEAGPVLRDGRRTVTGLWHPCPSCERQAPAVWRERSHAGPTMEEEIPF